LKQSEISAMYSLTVSLCYELKEASDANDKKFGVVSFQSTSYECFGLVDKFSYLRR